MSDAATMNDPVETPARIEPALLSDLSPQLGDTIAELTRESALLERALHPHTAASLADIVRLMNTYYSNLIEGHNTRPHEIERALQGDFDTDENRRNLQMEAAAHVRVQTEIDRRLAAGTLPAATSEEFLLWAHREFYRDAPEAMLQVSGSSRTIIMEPGRWRTHPEEDNQVGRHIPPSSDCVPAFMRHFQQRYDLTHAGISTRVAAIAAAHHRFNYIHPFPDGNGRVSRLMSHAMAHEAGIGAHGLWSISRGLARGLNSRLEYKQHMDAADSQRYDDTDGRGNLSLRGLRHFTLWFLQVCLDQVRFMSSLFDLDNLRDRMSQHINSTAGLKPESLPLLEEAWLRGQFDRGEVARITGLPERSARRVLSNLTTRGLLASNTAKGSVSLRFPESVLEDYFPRLYPRV